MSEPEYVAVNREQWTKANAEYTDARAHEAWSQREITWGTTRVRESDVNVIPEVAGKDVVELGCGTAYFGAWLARRGARVIGVDVTPAQLDTARRMEAEFALGLQFVEANAEATGLPSESFDLVLSEYGASSGCEIEDLVELFAAEDAVDHEYYHSNAEWAKNWPSEEIWRARLAPLAGIGSSRAKPRSADA